MSAEERTYPEPSINVESQPFWDAAAEGRFMLKRCKSCGETYYYPRAICPLCLSDDTEWYAASGKGTIYTYSVMRRAKVPYAIAYVTLEEGVSVMTNIVECDFDKLAVGQPVEVTFRKTEGDVSLPVFRPVPR